MKTTRLIIIALFFCVKICYATETYNSIYFMGLASIEIDGSLSDWNKFNIPQVDLVLDTVNSPEKPKNKQDISPQFQCCVDANNVYIALNIIDDKFIVGEEKLGKAFWDDSVFIHFPTPWIENSRTSIAISLDEHGKERIEYCEHPAGRKRLPYILDELGVKASMKQNHNGYNVEVSIPHRLIGTIIEDKKSTLNMNVEVFDDDDGEDHESALLLHFQGWWNPDWYYTNFTFTNTENQQYDTVIKNDNQTHDSTISVVIDNPAQSRTKDMIYSVLEHISYERWKDAENILFPMTGEKWADPLLVYVFKQQNKIESSVIILEKFLENSNDRYVNLWGKDYLAYEYLALDNTQRASQLFSELLSDSNWNIYRHAVTELGKISEKESGYESAVNIYEKENNKKPLNPMLLTELGNLHLKHDNVDKANEIYKKAIQSTSNNNYKAKWNIKLARTYARKNNPNEVKKCLQKTIDLYPNDYRKHFEVIDVYNESKEYDEAISVCNTIISNGNITEKDKARILLAKTHFYKKDFQSAKIVAENVVNSSSNSKTIMEAKMVLLSIEQFTK